ncbi:hypothetical protein DFH09DRAFT_1079054 [Mycena vulgaris]|nr:hypothetical protein DFH09DRAFT_1079054 [Mycena vulgaris]
MQSYSRRRWGRSGREAEKQRVPRGSGRAGDGREGWSAGGAYGGPPPWLEGRAPHIHIRIRTRVRNEGEGRGIPSTRRMCSSRGERRSFTPTQAYEREWERERALDPVGADAVWPSTSSPCLHVEGFADLGGALPYDRVARGTGHEAIAARRMRRCRAERSEATWARDGGGDGGWDEKEDGRERVVGKMEMSRRRVTLPSAVHLSPASFVGVRPRARCGDGAPRVVVFVIMRSAMTIGTHAPGADVRTGGRVRVRRDFAISARMEVGACWR